MLPGYHRWVPHIVIIICIICTYVHVCVYVLDMYIEGKVETSKTGYPSICFVTTRERVARFHDGYKRPADYFYAHNRILQSSSSDVLLNHLRNEIGSLYIY